MENKIDLVLDGNNNPVISAVKTALNIVFDNGSINITETAKIASGQELQRGTISQGPLASNPMQPANAELSALNEAFIADVFAIYEPYRKALSVIRSAANPSDF
ncbi:MAG: hypothetical protein H7Y13_11790 [Sphingobacteriaceae bacterium]|nr:hypothetical protein [Sphingobacteriaceae bacterium]